MLGAEQKQNNDDTSEVNHNNSEKPDTTGDLTFAQQLQWQDFEDLDKFDQSNQIQMSTQSELFSENGQSFHQNTEMLSNCKKHNILFARNIDCPLCEHENKHLLFDINDYSNDELNKYLDNLENKNGNKQKSKVRVDLDLTQSNNTSDDEQLPLPKYLHDDIDSEQSSPMLSNFHKKRRVQPASPTPDKNACEIIELSSDSSSDENNDNGDHDHSSNRNDAVNGNYNNQMPSLEHDLDFDSKEAKTTAEHDNEKNKTKDQSSSRNSNISKNNVNNNHINHSHPPAYTKNTGPNTTSKIPHFVYKTLERSNYTHIVIVEAKGNCSIIATLVFLQLKGLNSNGKLDTIESLRKAIQPLADEFEQKIQNDAVFVGENVANANVVSVQYSFNNTFGDNYLYWLGQVAKFNPIVYSYDGGYLCCAMYDSIVSNYKWNNDTPYILAILQGRIKDHMDLLVDDEMAYKFRLLKLQEKYDKQGIKIELKPLQFHALQSLINDKEKMEIQSLKAAEQLSKELNNN